MAEEMVSLNGMDCAIVMDGQGTVEKLRDTPNTVKAELYPEYYKALAYLLENGVTLTPFENPLLPAPQKQNTKYPNMPVWNPQVILFGPTVEAVIGFQTSLMKQAAENDARVRVIAERRFPVPERYSEKVAYSQAVKVLGKKSLAFFSDDIAYYLVAPSQYPATGFPLPRTSYTSIAYLGVQSASMTAEVFESNPGLALYRMLRIAETLDGFQEWAWEGDDLTKLRFMFVDEHSNLTGAWQVNYNLVY